MVCRCKILQLLATAAAVLLLMAPTAVNSTDTTDIMTLPPPAAGLSCQPFQANEIPYCAFLNYSTVGLPNARDHTTQMEAFTEMLDFKRLIETGCSGAILSFLCGYYAPVCIPMQQQASALSLLPCRSLCQEVRSKCDYFVQCDPDVQGGWPSHLDCDNFPTEMPCFGPNDPSTEIIPSNIPGITVTSVTRVASSSCVFREVTTTNHIQPTSSVREQLSSTPAMSTSAAVPTLRPTSELVVTDPPTDAATTVIIHSLTVVLCAALCVLMLL